MNKSAMKFGILFSIIHLCLLVVFIYKLKVMSGYEGQGPLLWIYWLIIDFPISLLVIFFFFFDITTSQYMLYIVHGIFGTLWWFFVPIIFVGIMDKFPKKQS